MKSDVSIDVTDVAGIGEKAWITATVHLPERLTSFGPHVVCFAKPGAGYSRKYYTLDLPGPTRGAQAGWHAARGWIFVSVDHLGVGESSHHARVATGYATLARAAHAAERVILQRLQGGDLVAGFPPVEHPLVLGVGQSLGGCMTVVQQARHRSYDGIAVLGYSPFRTQLPPPPGLSPWIQAWRLRDDPLVVTNEHVIAACNAADRDLLEEIAWCYFFDDLDRSQMRFGDVSAPWASATIPGAIETVVTPSAVASEAASIDVPVLLAMGERDVVSDPRGEARSYLSSDSVDLYICPRMGHMHNFASTRILLWQRLAAWGAWVSAGHEAAGATSSH